MYAKSASGKDSRPTLARDSCTPMHAYQTATGLHFCLPQHSVPAAASVLAYTEQQVAAFSTIML